MVEGFLRCLVRSFFQWCLRLLVWTLPAGCFFALEKRLEGLGNHQDDAQAHEGAAKRASFPKTKTKPTLSFPHAAQGSGTTRGSESA